MGEEISVAPVAAASPKTQRLVHEAKALLHWKNSLISYSPIITSSWTWSDHLTTTPCSWIGILCDNYLDSIVEINLNDSSLNGTLHQFDFSSFPYLTSLNVFSNYLFGEIPIEIGSLSKLISLDLGDNYFTGTIPSEIGDLLQLRILRLANNSLTGTLHQLNFSSAFPNLTNLTLTSNHLFGEIPSQIGSLSKLISLHLGANKFTVMNLKHNQLVGSIPQGNQFNTFSSSSYEDNPRLCGFPLSRQCKDTYAISPPTTYQQYEVSMSTSDFDWKSMMIGYGSGMVIGVSLGYITFWKENGCLTRTFERKQCSRGKRLKRIHRFQ